MHKDKEEFTKKHSITPYKNKEGKPTVKTCMHKCENSIINERIMTREINRNAEIKMKDRNTKKQTYGKKAIPNAQQKRKTDRTKTAYNIPKSRNPETQKDKNKRKCSKKDMQKGMNEPMK